MYALCILLVSVGDRRPCYRVWRSSGCCTRWRSSALASRPWGRAAGREVLPVPDRRPSVWVQLVWTNNCQCSVQFPQCNVQDLSVQQFPCYNVQDSEPCSWAIYFQVTIPETYVLLARQPCIGLPLHLSPLAIADVLQKWRADVPCLQNWRAGQVSGTENG